MKWTNNQKDKWNDTWWFKLYRVNKNKQKSFLNVKTFEKILFVLYSLCTKYSCFIFCDFYVILSVLSLIFNFLISEHATWHRTAQIAAVNCVAVAVIAQSSKKRSKDASANTTTVAMSSARRAGRSRSDTNAVNYFMHLSFNFSPLKLSRA